MIPDIGACYDRVPYEGTAYGASHPNALAVAATLTGLTPTPLDRCRVLEIGCAAGNNLLPMASAYPTSEFVGIDLSGVQVEAGQAFLATANLPNVTLHHMSVMDIPESLGKFDYIICHGVWSWVPPAVQDKILEVSHDFLTANGLAYISYNTLPGWNWRRTLRDLMLLHASHYQEPEVKVKAAREFLDLLAGNFPEANKTPFATFLREENDRMKQRRDSYVLHEYLEEFNQPVYFKDFVARADKVGLQYVAESRVATMALGLLARPVADALRKLPLSPIEREQYIDFARNRTFRETILCPKDRKFERRITADSIKTLLIACAAVTETPVTDFRSKEAVKFKWGAARSADVSAPAIKAALAHLGSIYPRAIPFAELVEVVSNKIAGEGQPALTVANDGNLAGSLLDAFLRSLVEFHFQLPEVVSTVSAKPIASPPASEGGHLTDS